MNKTICATGKGKFSLRPDLIDLHLSVSDTFNDFELTAEESLKALNELKELLPKADLDPKDLLSDAFSITTEYENYRDENNEYHKRFIGYSYHHQLHISFNNDNRLLGKVLYLIANCERSFESSFSYSLKDKEKIKDELLKSAYEDALRQAKVLADASKVTLKGIISISHDFNGLDNYILHPIKAFSRNLSADDKASGAYDIDINADDLTFEDSIRVIWEIA